MTTASNTAMICHANTYRFIAGQVIGPRIVQSRMFIWVRSGQGQLVVNDQPLSMQPSCWAFLPWVHQITYHADHDDPFIIGCIHIIPHLVNDGQEVFRIHHSDYNDSPLWTGRDDARLTGIPQELQTGTLQSGEQLFELVNYIVHGWHRGPPSVQSAKLQCELFLNELSTAVQQQPQPALPTRLITVMNAVRARIDQQLSIQQLADQANISEATLNRLFRRHLNCSPLSWLNQQRIALAQDLLQHSGDAISCISQQCGYSDPVYFARLFRKQCGCTPSEYRKRNSM